MESTECKMTTEELAYRIGMADTTRLRRLYRQMCWLLVDTEGEERERGLEALEKLVQAMCNVMKQRHEERGGRIYGKI